MATKKNTKKAAPKKKVVAKKPVKKAPAKKKVVAKKPAVKKKPVVKKAPVKKAVPKKKPVAKKPITKKPAKKSVTKKVVAKKPVTKQPVKKGTLAKPSKDKKVIAKAKKEVTSTKIDKSKKPVVKEIVKKKEEPKKEVKPVVKVEAKPVKEEKPKKEAASTKLSTSKKPEMRMAAKPKVPQKTRSEKNSPFYKQPDIKALASINPAFKIHNARPNIMKPAVAKIQDTRSRYSDAELQEFKEIILKKLEEARKDLEMLRGSLSHTDDHGTDDTSPTFKMMEDGSETLSREETAQLAGRQEKFIMALDNALIRIENKTYGVCRVTGNLISKDRLKLVPHTTLSIEAKNMQD